MNTEDHASTESPFSDPQSPGLPHLHRHQPTTERHDDPMQTDGLRRRHQGGRDTAAAGASSSSTSTMRIQIQTPFSDLGDSRRKEVVVDRAMSVKDLKDGLATGRWYDEVWVRDGMRLVWRGRIVQDSEKLGDVLASADEGVHTFHLVARHSESLSRSTSRRRHPVLPPILAQDQQPAATIPSEALPLPPARGRAEVALQDSLHYLYFFARHHLCLLLGSEPLAWDDTTPPPVVDQSSARLAVMTVVRGVAQTRMTREEGWEEWERAFDGVEAILVEDRAALEGSAKGIWASTTGRAWSDEAAGNRVSVELDGVTYDLNLPPIHQITNDHLAHLLQYLRITSLIPLLLSVVEHEFRLGNTPPPVPSPTRLVPALPQQNQARVLLRLRIPFIPVSVLTHMAYSALKIAAMLWMLSRDMKWGDVRFWILSGAAAGWWLGDALNVWVRERPRVAVRPNAGPEGDNAPGGAGGPANANAGAGQGQGQAQGANDGAPGVANAPTPAQPPSFSSATAFIPLIHLSTDSAQLGHPSANPNQRIRTPVRRIPARLQTQFILPVILWFVTLIPDWENVRARMIRRRERAMRVVVGELNTAAAPPDDPANEVTEGETDRPNVYPEGLNAVAKRYYERVMARGDGIDWEEEREAQRAMGIPDENAGGGGMGMGLLG